MKFKIENTEVYGINKSAIASGNAMRTEMKDNTQEPSKKDVDRAKTLGNTGCGEGHDNFLNGIVVQFDLYAPLYMWKQIQRYHFLDFISSQSTMHRLTKFKVKECCVEDTDEVILNRYQELLDDYNSRELTQTSPEWRTLVASLPCGFVLGATMTTNYRQLKTMYNQRKSHKLKEWHEFCDWCDTLPYFSDLTGCKREKNNIVYGKRVLEDGSKVEDKSMTARKFINKEGREVIKACFCCSKAKDCNAVNIDECVYDKPDNVVIIDTWGKTEKGQKE